MNKDQQQFKTQQLKLRAQNNPTSCSNVALLISHRKVSSQVKNQKQADSTLSLVMRDIRDYLDIGAGKALRIA